MELQLPGRPSELEKAGEKTNVPKRAPTMPFHMRIYIYESGGGANWTPLHEFSCVP